MAWLKYCVAKVEHIFDICKYFKKKAVKTVFFYSASIKKAVKIAFFKGTSIKKTLL
jgi:hypothetical protein